MTLIMDMKKQIQNIKNETIKKILNTHFNPDATSLSFLFNRIHKKNDRAKDNEWLDNQAVNKNERPETKILATAFAHAPTEVCNELLHALITMEKQDAVDIISMPWKGILSLSGGFYNIYITAPKAIRLALSKWVSQLEPKQIMQIFLGKRSLLGYSDSLFYKRSLDIFAFNDPDAVKNVIQALKKLNNQDLLTLFQTHSLPLPRYCGLVDLFSKISNDETAILLLNLVKTLPVNSLKLLFYGRIMYTGSREEVDNLMRQVSRFSPQVVTKALHLLNLLPISDVKTLLLSGEDDYFNPLTPLETTFQSRHLFQPSVQAELAIAFINALKHNDALRQLLIKAPRQDSEPFLHKLVRNQVLPAIAHYLEQAELPTEHSNMHGETALYIAQTMKNSDATCLLKARSLYYHLLREKNTPAFKQALTDKFEKTIKHFPGILATRWAENKTLAHIAIAKKNATALAFFLEHGADPNAKDAYQLSLLDYAMKSAHLESLQALASHPKSDFTQTGYDGKLPLPYLLNHSDYTIAKGVITNLRAQNSQITAQSFAKALVQKPKTHLQLSALQQQLHKPKKAGSLCHLLETYSEQKNDSRVLFLLHAGELVCNSKDPELIEAASHFLVNELNTLADGSANPFAKNQARATLLLFLFAMKPSELLVFLKAQTLTDEQKTQWDLALCHGLVQPLIFSRFTHQEHQQIHSCFSDEKASLNNIAHIHFRHSDLTLLPPSLLQKLAEELPENELYKHCENRRHPSLLILTLERELANESPDEQKVTLLVDKLTKEMNLFNQESVTHSQDELRLMLHLTKTSRIKNVIKEFIFKQKENAAIISKIDALFTAFRRDEPLIEESLLREIYIHHANNPLKIREPINQTALTEIVSIASAQEVDVILTNVQKTLLPRLKIDSLLTTTASTNKKTPHDFKSPIWLYSLANKTARMTLFPFVSMASELSDEARALSAVLKEDKDFLLKNTLASLAKALSKLADALIKNQFENTSPAWTKAVNSAFKSMQKECKLASTALEKNLAQTPVGQAQPPIKQQLICLIKEQAGNTFPNALQKAYFALEEKQDLSIQQTLALDAPLEPLQALFDIQKTPLHEPSLAKAMDWQADDLRQTMTRLNSSITKGIMANRECEQLLPIISNWQMNHGYLAPTPALLQQLAPLIATLNADTLKSISEQQDAVLVFAEKSAPLLKKLKRLHDEKSNFHEILDVLTASDTETLTSFVALTAKAQLHDLNHISHYALTGKKQYEDNTLLKNSEINYPISWLQKSVATLESFASNALSIKALITGAYQNEEQYDARLNAFSGLVKAHKIPLTEQAIILFATSFGTTLNKDLFSPISCAFVLAFSELLQQSHFSLQTNVIANLSSELTHQLLEHCLAGISSDDPTRADSCKILLTRICQQSGNDCETNLILIKKRLGQQDLGFLNDDSLIALANEVLNEKEEFDSLTLDGVWIQRLLVSPRFIAVCTPHLIQLLTERYRALSLTLKQTEFENLNRFITGKLSFAEQHNEAFTRWQKELLAKPEAKARLLEKQKRLLAFRADDSIRALFNQLEDNCLEIRKTEPELAEKALNTLYTHHQQQLASLRSDVLFRMADFVYTRAMRAEGDIPKSQNPLLSWLEQHLPHYNFQQSELERKTHVYLYDENGKKVGYLDESNHAFTLVNDEPIPLLDCDFWEAGSLLYDKNRQRLGVLTSSGQLKHENLFQHQSSALLMGKMPINQLELSPAALDLLIQDIFIENSLDTLFKASDSKEKSIWIQKKLIQSFKKEKKLLSPELMSSFVAHQPIEAILETLGKDMQSTNAEHLFKAIFTNDTKRSEFFANRKSPFIAEFFKHANVEALLSDYLHQHHDKPWFNEGLLFFAEYAQQNSKRNMLSDSLQALHTCTIKKTLAITTFDAILSTLLGSNAVAKTILQEFLKDASDLSVQKSRSRHCDKLTRFFSKSHLISAVKLLNKQKSWGKSHQYRLVLMICNAENERLFPSLESHSTEKNAWNAEELKQMSTFAIRHVRMPNTHDKNNTIGQHLLGNLVFRCAKAGLTDLFYQKNGKLNARVARSYLKRSTLNALASRLYLINSAKENIKKFRSKVKKWFASSDDDNILDELKENHAIIDWKALAKESWAHTKSTKLPLIAAFLINYSGDSAPLLRLLQDILTNKRLLKKGEMAHHISQIMACYPHRDVSHVIFKALEEAAINNTNVIDNIVFKNMRIFHAYAHPFDNKSSKPLQTDLALLRHFGQQKHYVLTQHCAKLLYTPVSWKRFFAKCLGSQPDSNDMLNKQYKRVLIEAHTEGALQEKIGCRFFNTKKALKRWWNYGRRGTKNPTEMVKFFDDDTSYTHPGKMPARVKTAEIGSSTEEKEDLSSSNRARTKKRYQAFFNKEKLKEKMAKELPSLPKAPGKLGFFAEAKKALDTPVPEKIPIFGMVG